MEISVLETAHCWDHLARGLLGHLLRTPRYVIDRQRHCAAAEKAHHRRRRGARERGCLGLVVVKKVFDGDARRSRHRIAERVLTLHAGITRAGVHEESTCAGNPVLVLYLLLFWCVVLVVTVDVPDPWMV